jgi:hypothetical protein
MVDCSVIPDLVFDCSIEFRLFTPNELTRVFSRLDWRFYHRVRRYLQRNYREYIIEFRKLIFAQLREFAGYLDRPNREIDIPYGKFLLLHYSILARITINYLPVFKTIGVPIGMFSQLLPIEAFRITWNQEEILSLLSRIGNDDRLRVLIFFLREESLIDKIEDQWTLLRAIGVGIHIFITHMSKMGTDLNIRQAEPFPQRYLFGPFDNIIPT